MDITGALLEEVCHDVAIEPILQPVTDNNLVRLTANTNDSARLDASARSFWIISQKAFFGATTCLTPTLHNTNLKVLN